MANRRSYVSRERSWTQKSTQKPAVRDIAWAAGFYEGEGSCRLSRCGGISASTVQVNKEPLERMLRLFGGSLHSVERKSANLPIWYWLVCGIRARGFLQTIYALLSERRKAQVRKAMACQK